jgi:hypothetical protein
VFAELGQERGDLRLEGLSIDRELDCGGGALKTVKVFGQRKWLARVQADDFKDAVAAQKPVVRRRNCGFGGIRYLSIDTAQHG